MTPRRSSLDQEQTSAQGNDHQTGIGASGADRNNGTHRNLHRFLMILRALSEGPPGGLRAVDVAHAIGLGRATSHRLLLGLASQGIVEHDPKSARFSVSRLAVKWGLAALNRHGLAEAGLRSVRKLSEMTGDTAYLAIRSIDHAECVDYAEGSFPIKALTMQVGDKTTLLEGAFGLAILAQLQDQEIETLVQHSTRNGTAFDHAGLWADISQTRQSGIAIKETATGITSMAAPIRGRTGDVLGAIGLSAISTRFAEGRRDRLVPLLRDAAAQIEQAILDQQT